MDTSPEVTLDQFDTKALSEAGIVIELDELPTDPAGQPYFIEILGMDADATVDEDRRRLDKKVRKIRKNQDLGDTKEEEQALIEKLAKITTRWHLPPLTKGEAELPCTKENARRLYSDVRFRWILRKVSKEQQNEARFFANSSTS